MNLPAIIGLKDIETVKDFKTLTKRGERKGKWYCTTPGCGKNFTDYIDKLSNDCKEHSFICSGCGQVKHVNAAIIVTIMIQKNLKENLAMGDAK